MRVLGIISLLFFTSCYIPQIIAILKTKDVRGISVGLWVLLIAGYVTGLCYVISLRDYILVTTYSVGLILALWVFGLIVYYKKQGAK